MTRAVAALGVFLAVLLPPGPGDKPEYLYPVDNSGASVSSDSFIIRMRLNDPAVYQVGSSLRARVRVEPLRDSENSYLVPVDTVVRSRHGSEHLASIRVPVRTARTVYRARVRFYDGETEVGQHAGWYYTTTTGTQADDEMRTNILLRGFHEYHEQEMGRVGPRGTAYVDGTKYGARRGEQWCSEFYIWVTGPFLKGISNDTNVTRLVSYFKRKEAYLEPQLLERQARRGDYIAYNWKGRGGLLDHSGMFLAWDQSANPPVAWTLEGNIGNSVVIKERSTSDMDGFGRISGIDLPNHPACDEWCRNDERCAKCSRLPGCGVGYEPLKSWTGAGPNYYACREKPRSQNNHETCNAWCTAHGDCAKCSTEPYCGIGYERMASFTANGTNWYACREKAQSRGNHEACLEWCGTRPECDKCSVRLGCGVGYRQIKSWTSGGTNWYACAER